jgi:hypothetical protein
MWESISHWLQTNAPAAWISATAALITLLFVLRSRKKPRKLVFREIRNSSVITISPAIRDRIQIRFDNRGVQSLGQIEAEIRNTGSEPILNPSFTLVVPPESTILSASMAPGLDVDSSIQVNKVTSKWPYLNSVRDHGHVLKFSILVDGPTKIASVTGGGEGWSVKFEPKRSRRIEKYFITVQLVFFALAGVGYRFLGELFGLRPIASTTQDFWAVVTVSVAIGFVTIAVYGFLKIKKPSDD